MASRRGVGESKERIDGDGAALRLLLAEDDPNLRDVLVATLARFGFVIAAPADITQSLTALAEQEFDVVILDVGVRRAAAVDAVRALRARGDDADIIVVTGHAKSETGGLAGPLEGAYCIAKPFALRTLIEVVRHSARHQRIRRENLALRRAVAQQESRATIDGQSEAIAGVRAIVERAGGSRSHVLIVGEAGSGRTRAARAIHQGGGPRHDLPLLALDCRLATELLEPELFGHEGEPGGSSSRRPGLLELAHEGTLILKEVSALSLGAQAKLLRALDHGEVRRVGGESTVHVDVRIVATTQDLGAAVARGEFRADLYYRLGAVVVHMPPLRQRVEDIPLLAQHIARSLGQRPPKFTSETLAMLGRCPWPGNVRELRNVVERLGLLASSEEITPADVAPHLLEMSPDAPDTLLSLEELERRHILKVLRRTGLNRARTAKILGVDPKTLYNKLKSYDEVE